MLKFNKIYNLDCIDGLKKLDDESIDLIITSPPYNLGNNHHTGNKKIFAYDDNLNEKDYQSSQINMLEQCYRVLKNSGSMMYQHKNRIKKGIQISPYEWIFKTQFCIKQEIVWINRSQNFDKIRFYPFTERVYWLAKNPKTKLYNNINKYDVFDWNEWKPVGTKGNHQRAFPEKMVSDLISVFPDSTNILDPYMGSGTVAVVAKALGKNYIGFEIDKNYIDIANQRINNSDLLTPKQSLFI
jgi:site-specific DNA-methyltransferase (adenine-specific)